MQERNIGLTSLYNLFHDSGDRSEDVVRLRRLHVEIDGAAAAAFRWDDLDLSHGFQTTRQGVRYTIAESGRRVVLERLLALNHQRHAQEAQAPVGEKRSEGSRVTKSKKKRGPAPSLFG